MIIVDKVKIAKASTTHGNLELARDGDWATSCHGYAGDQGMQSLRMTVKFEWDRPVIIMSVEYRVYSLGAVGWKSNGARGGYEVHLMRNDEWNIKVDSAYASCTKESTFRVDSGQKIVEGPWRDIQGIKFYIYGNADGESSQTAFCNGWLYEARAYAQAGGYMILI